MAGGCGRGVVWWGGKGEHEWRRGVGVCREQQRARGKPNWAAQFGTSCGTKPRARGREGKGGSQVASPGVPSVAGFRFDLPIGSQLGRSNWHAIWDKEIKISRFQDFICFKISRLKLDTGR